MTTSIYKPQRLPSHTQRTDIATVDSNWPALFSIGGVAALLSAVLIPIQVVAYIIWPPPSTVANWFSLLQNNWLAGLINLDLLLAVDNVLLILVFLALYMALRRTSEAVMASATVLGVVGVLLLVSAIPAFEMLTLSKRYTVATTEEDRAMLIAAGYALLATWDGTAFQVAYFLGSSVGVAIGVVMLRSNHFGKVAAYLGILGNVVAYGYYLPTVGVYVSVFSVLFLEIWYILVGRKLLQFSQIGLLEESKRT